MDKGVWRRAAKLGVSVGLLQAAINQGEFWVAQAVTAAVVVKTILTPLVTFAVALFAGAGSEKRKGD
jgi:hypothetical protein